MPKEDEDSYLTIESSCEGLFKAKGSKHFGYIFPLFHADELKKHLDDLRQVHPSAGHLAFAYRLGNLGEEWRVHDDGEPNNTAGPPILGALRSHEMTFCLGVVVRYFGGTKLGVGGLIEAYREATNAAIKNGVIVHRYPTSFISVVFPYQQLGPVMSLLKRQKLSPIDPDFQLTCTLSLEIRSNAVSTFIENLLLIPDVRVNSEMKGNRKH